MSMFVVDVEADGPAPGLYSMVSFGAVKVEEGFSDTFYGETAPITDNYIQEALSVSGFSREQHEQMSDPKNTIGSFIKWIEKTNTDGRPIFISDNPAFDWQFINYYCHKYFNHNPFGHSARRIGDFYAGLRKDFRNTNGWKKLRDTKHTHNPVDDALGNAEALFKLIKS